MIAKTLLLFAVLPGFSGMAHAQVGVCPEGMIPGGDQYNPNDCVPDPSYQQQQQQPQPSAPPSSIWADRWGALASDDAAAILGAVTNMPSKLMAETLAMRQCQGKGEKRCKPLFTYHNQCAVMIIGSNTLNATGGPTVANATDVGMKPCNRENTTCRIYYSGCSYPIRIQQRGRANTP